MIDYVKIHLEQVDIPALLKNELLEFETVVSEKTGELSKSKSAEYHFCKIIIYDSGLVVFQGSIHKLFNSLNGIEAPNKSTTKRYKGFNGNQFTLSNIIEVRNHLENLFKCESRQMILKNIEIGVNTNPLFSPKNYIKGLLYHNGKQFEYKYNGNLAQSEHQRFIFKIYDKSNQYSMQEHTLRIELKILKEIEFKRVGLRTFQDINEQTLSESAKLLLNRFNEVMHYDYTIKKEELSLSQNRSLENYSNPRYWLIDLVPKNRHRHKENLHQITIKYSDNLQEQLRQEIIKKCRIINRESGEEKKTRCRIINSSSIGLIIPQEGNNSGVKKCSVTGLDLSLENSNSNYIKTTTLYYLFRNEKNKYINLCSFLLNKSKEANPKFENTKIKHLAKQVRNRFYNKNKIKKTGYKTKIYFNQFSLTI